MSRIVVNNVTKNRELLWLRVKIKKSLDDICHTLEMEIPAGERLNVRRHDKIQVRVDNPLITERGGVDTVTTVMVDEVTVSADATSHRVTVIGRSPARDIIDSAWRNTLWTKPEENWTLAKITKEIADRFKIPDVSEIAVSWFPKGSPDPTATVNYFAWQNESPWAKLLTEADAQGFLITSNQAGGLYVWKPQATVRSEGFNATEGENVKTVEWRENGAEQYHEYVVSGAFGDAVVFDTSCRNRRVLTIDLTDEAVGEEKRRRRAETEMRRRRETRVTVTVAGWGLSDRQIRALDNRSGKEFFWSVNFLIPVRMPSLGLSNNLLISEAEFEADDKSMQTTITLVNREAYL